MTKKLDAEKIELARQKQQKTNSKEIERQRIRDTIEQNKNGNRKVTVIMPQKKKYAFEDTPKIRVAAYCRVSTAEEAQVGSFEMQIQHYESVFETNKHRYIKVKIYTDEGISGTSLNKRLGFQEMIEDCKQGKIDLILTKSISRFGRNIVDMLTTLRLLSDLTPPVAVMFETEGINTADNSNKLIISVLSALAEMESQVKSVKSVCL